MARPRTQAARLHNSRDHIESIASNSFRVLQHGRWKSAILAQRPLTLSKTVPTRQSGRCLYRQLTRYRYRQRGRYGPPLNGRCSLPKVARLLTKAPSARLRCPYQYEEKETQPKSKSFQRTCWNRETKCSNRSMRTSRFW